ncbi:MAG: patatin-like phospholipase family protein, partial [Oscillospiraceae bacterium]|nr:patatin-like phospholipase family protein [Oscillospiraceae bacterium]
MKTGLVLEGGGMRGMYTIGILDYFLDAGINFDYVIGVSAGACNGVSFVSKQKGRSYRINSNYIDDKRYLSVSNLIKEGSLFGMDFLFKDIPEVLEPFDYDTFMANP